MAEAITLGEFGFPAKECGRELVCFIAHHQIPLAVRGLQLRLYVLVTGELVETRNHEVVFCKPIPGAGSFQFVVRHDLERELKPPVEFVLPLLCEAAWTYDEASLKVTAHDEFLNQQSCHDRLTSARIVG